MRLLLRVLARWAALCLALLLAACAVDPALEVAGSDPFSTSEWARRSSIAGQVNPLGWEHKVFANRQPTVYRPVEFEGLPAVHAFSAAGNSTLRTSVAMAPDQVAQRLHFSWYLKALNTQADLRDRDRDDAAARVILTFDRDRHQGFSARDHMLSELALLLTGEPLPYATLMYVWDDRYPVGTVIDNPHTRRIRQLVVESGPTRLGQWVAVERDVEADFREVFGEAPGALTAVGLMSDTNNTGASVDAWFGPLALTSALRAEGSPPSAHADVGLIASDRSRAD